MATTAQILVIFTGGVIGSRQGPDYTLELTPETSKDLLNRYERSHGGEVSFVTSSPFFTLSENLVPENWHQLLKAIKEHDPKTLSGIIIAHGTDTMAYTAAAMAMTLSGLSIPVVLTGANYPTDDRRSNGYRNFCNAVDFIRDPAAPRQGTFVVYENNGDRRCLVHLGSRVVTSASFSNEFDSLGGVHYGEMLNRKFQRLPDRVNPSNIEFKELTGPGLGTKAPKFSPDILLLTPFPGLNYTYYDALIKEKKPKAVLHRLFHSGAACSPGKAGPHSLPHFTKHCLKAGIPVYTCPSREKLMVEKFITNLPLLEAGIRPLENITPETALIKLMLAYGNLKDADAIEAFLLNDVQFEYMDFRRSGYGRQRRKS